MYLLDPTSMGSFRGLSLRRASSIAPLTVFRPSQKSRAVLVCEETRGVCVWKPLKIETDIRFNPFLCIFHTSYLREISPLVREEQEVSLHNINEKSICPKYYNVSTLLTLLWPTNRPFWGVVFHRLLCTFFRTDIFEKTKLVI